MSLKNKIKGAWQRVSDLEDESADARQQALSNERIPYKEISKKLKELMKKNVDVVGRKILIPNYYVVRFSKYDREMRKEVEDVLCSELTEELYPEMRKINPEQSRNAIVIEVETDPGLVKGQFSIDYRMKKPEPQQRDETKETPEAAPPLPLPDTEMDLKETVTEDPETFDADEHPTVVQTAEPVVQIKLSIDSGQEVQEVTFEKDRITIGRASHDDVVLESQDFSVSRGHAAIELRDGSYFLLPTGVNGTLLNGQELELQKEVPISPADEIKIVNYTMKILE
ncbi:MAG: FhaA domain-containing protein [bacterium]